MGLKQTNIEDWIELNDTYLEKYNLKKQLYKEQRAKVLAYLPGYEDGVFEALELLKDTLIRRYPTMFRHRNHSTIENLVTGDVWDLHPDAATWKTHHPLEVMGLLATEDFFMLHNNTETGESILTSGGVCFPGGFKIEERVGQSLWGIHAGKVRQYETKLAKSMDRFFLKLKVESAISRSNFAIEDRPELFHRHPHHNLSLEDVENPPTPDNLYLRVERQFLQRLPKSRGLLLTFHTYVTPVIEVTEDKDVARALRTSVSSFSGELAKYKNKVLWQKGLLSHISEVLGESVASLDASSDNRL
ncbi:hypothetical protein SCUP515_10247 [Seiridium cupressi]